MTTTTPTRRLILAAAGFGLAAAVSGQALAAAQPPATPLSAEDQALVDKATAYIQTLGSAKGRFVQTDARGTQTQGTFYLQRPARPASPMTVRPACWWSATAAPSTSSTAA
jgi:outer membrane lipoprotein-sorting protein